jgi:hypothetical protein
MEGAFDWVPLLRDPRLLYDFENLVDQCLCLVEARLQLSLLKALCSDAGAARDNSLDEDGSAATGHGSAALASKKAEKGFTGSRFAI